MNFSEPFQNYLEFSEVIISRATLNDCIWVFQSFTFFVRSHLPLFTRLYGTNFPIFCEFWSIWQKSIPTKFSFQGLFAKVDDCKEFFSNSFAKIAEISHFSSFLLDFVIESFPIRKKHNVYLLKQIPVKFSKSFWGVFVFIFKLFPKTANVFLLMFSSKVWFVVIWCWTFKNFECSLLLQFPKYGKTWKINSQSYLLPTTPRISPLLSENVIAPWLQVPPKK